MTTDSKCLRETLGVACFAVCVFVCACSYECQCACVNDSKYFAEAVEEGRMVSAPVCAIVHACVWACAIVCAFEYGCVIKDLQGLVISV